MSQGVRAAVALALAGLAVVAVSALADARAALAAWLFAFATTVAFVLGALAMLSIGIVAHASWPLVLRKPLEAIVATLPVQAAFFLPIALFAPRIYPWASAHPALDPDALANLAEKRAWLNLPAWEARAAVCFAVWLAIAWLLLRTSTRQDAGDAGATSRLRAVAAVGLPPLAITLTIASFDWLMSLEPAWVSNAYGLYVFVGGFASAVAVVALVFAREHAAGELPEGVGPSHAHALGNLLLAAVMLWAYIAFSQFLILWIADVPEEIVWYARRASHGWASVAFALSLAQFALPFAALLLRDLKRHPRALAAVAVVVLLGHAIDVWWLVAPVFSARVTLPWREVAALTATMSLTWLAATRRARASAAQPRNDPLYPASLRFEMR